MIFDIDVDTLYLKFRDYLLSNSNVVLLYKREYDSIDLWFSYEVFVFHVKVTTDDVVRIYEVDEDQAWDMFMDEFINNNPQAIRVRKWQI